MVQAKIKVSKPVFKKAATYASASKAAKIRLKIKSDLLTRGRIVIIGLGGIGAILATYLILFLSSLRHLSIRVQLIDGDTYEERNRERMEVPALENKAAAMCQRLTARFGRPQLYIRPVPQYVTAANAGELLKEGDLVFACVDRHASRKIVSDRCSRLKNVILISGGNDGVENGLRGTYGNVQIFRRQNGVEINPPLTRFHPEVQKPADRLPELSCADLAATTAPQILFANLAAACAMCCAFYRLLTEKDSNCGKRGTGNNGAAASAARMYDELCFDIFEGCFTPKRY